MSLVAVNNQEPVTALHFFGQDRLVAGVGSFLKVYAWKTGTVLSKLQIFPVHKVHGITGFSGGDRAIAWGGSNIAVVSGLNTQLHVDSVFNCKDRIADIAILKDTRAYILTAHNEVLEVDVASMRVVKRHMCSERSILYSGSLYVRDDRQMVAAGTVFGGVVLWDLQNDSIAKTIESHEGSIFDISWSEDGQYVASCSDDRTVIITRVSSGELVARGWGHISRIWKLKFLSPSSLISVAEDCSARVWKLVEGSTTLECTRIMTGHHGRNIWSLDVMNGSNVAATGGGDGRIMLWDLEENLISEYTSYNVESTFGKQIRSCAISETSGTVVVTCHDGKAFSNNPGSNWVELPAQLGPVPIVKASTGGGFLAISNDGSALKISDMGDLEFTFSLAMKVLDFFVLSGSKILVMPTPPNTKLILVSSISASDSLVTNEFNQKPGLGVVSCIVDTTEYTDNTPSFIIGSRNGGLALYKLGNADPELVVPVALGAKNEAITSMKIVDSGTEPYMIATARSSDYGMFTLPHLKRMFKNRARKRGSIEGSQLHRQGLLFWGFQKDLFIAWNATLGFEMVAFDAGGSHRAWTCAPLVTGGLCYVYVRNHELYIMHISVPSSKFERPLLQQGTHGREIRGLEVCPTDPRLIATASEDTTVNAGWLNPETMAMEDVCTVGGGHVSGIQTLHWHPAGRYLFTGAGNGELVMWKVITRGESVFVDEVSKMPSRGLDELRVMDTSVLPSASGDLVAVAFSDSSFRIWRVKEYTEDKFLWDLLLEQKYSERCLLNIDLFEWQQPGKQWLSFSSTDGYMMMYELTKPEPNSPKLAATLRLRSQVHQSNIRCSTFVHTEDTLVYVSGGDDNSLNALAIDSNCTPRTVFNTPGAHASAITAVEYLPQQKLLATTGSDQKVQLWAMDGRLVYKTITDVSDTDVMTRKGDWLIVGGIGLGFLKMDTI